MVCRRSRRCGRWLRLGRWRLHFCRRCQRFLGRWGMSLGCCRRRQRLFVLQRLFLTVQTGKRREVRKSGQQPQPILNSLQMPDRHTPEQLCKIAGEHSSDTGWVFSLPPVWIRLVGDFDVLVQPQGQFVVVLLCIIKGDLCLSGSSEG